MLIMRIFMHEVLARMNKCEYLDSLADYSESMWISPFQADVVFAL